MFTDEYRFKGKYSIFVSLDNVIIKKDDTNLFQTYELKDIYKAYAFMSPFQISFNGTSSELIRFIAESAVPSTFIKHNIPLSEIPFYSINRESPIIKYWTQCINFNNLVN